MLVIFRPEKCVPPMGSTRYLDHIALHEGVNDTLTAEDIKALKAHDSYPQYEKWGAIEIKEDVTPGVVDPQANTEVADLANYNEDDATDIIRETIDKDTLARWLSTETRKGVRSVLTARIKSL